MNLPKPSHWMVVPALAFGLWANAHAAGMVPDTTLLRVNVADGEATLNVTNTDAAPSLLYTSLTTLEQKPQALLLASPPIARVEPGEKQLVRFILKPGQTIADQQLLRVIFEGIPQHKTGDTAELAVTVRQNLPVIIHPKGLADNSQPWKLLTWTADATGITVNNDSPYVVRLNQHLNVLPGNLSLQLPHTYLLPRTRLQLVLAKPLGSGPHTVRLYPASQYGFQGQSYDAPLSCAPGATGCLP